MKKTNKDELKLLDSQLMPFDFGKLPSFDEIAHDLAQSIGLVAPLLEITDLETKLDGIPERSEIDLGLEALLVEINLDALLAMEALWGDGTH